jgi:hypothetical protein
MLPVDEPIATVRRFAGREQQRIAALAHQRIGAEHGFELTVPFLTDDAPFPSAFRCEAFVAAGARLMISDEAEQAVRHQPQLPLMTKACARRIGRYSARRSAHHRIGPSAPVMVIYGLHVLRVYSAWPFLATRCQRRRGDFIFIPGISAGFSFGSRGWRFLPGRGLFGMLMPGSSCPAHMRVRRPPDCQRRAQQERKKLHTNSVIDWRTPTLCQ